jgi:hypothetical protein
MRKHWVAIVLVAASFGSADAQVLELNENCTISILNRSVPVDPDGGWVLPNVPTNVGMVRARATCVENGVTRSGQSDYFIVPPNGTVRVPDIRLDQPMAPIPARIALNASTTQLGNVGATVQVAAIATYADGTSRSLSLAAQGTNWFTSNPLIATVSPDGLVTATGTGNVLISAMNEGALGMLRISILTSGDTDGDGLPDEFEIANGLDPGNPADAAGDLDGDGLSNLEEFRNGTLLNVGDSDSDGLNDGAEVGLGTNPLLADTDNDGIRDGLEVQTGTDPLNAASFNLALALQSLSVSPSSFEIVVNTLMGESSRLVAVTGNLRDGTTINLTARSRGTSYDSSNLFVASFGATDGQIFGGTNGTATVTIENNGHTTTASVSVRNFAPQAVAFLPMPGFANNVDVAGNYAYVAAGSAGLVVVNVTNRAAPSIVATLDTPGNANDVKVVSGIAYVADGVSGLQIIDVSNPALPRLIGTLDTADAWDVSVSGGTAYVADGAAGLKIVDVRNGAAPALVGYVDTPGIAKGVDVAGNYAIVADGSSTAVIDVTVPSVPALVGVVGTSQARDVVAEGTLAYVADYGMTLRIIDFSNPAAPRIVGTPNGAQAGIPTDVAKARELVFLSEVVFVNGVSITDVGSPTNPTVRARLDFPQRDDNGTGIAVDHQFIYLTGERGFSENGTSGDTALYIGQYLFAEDTAGIAPVVQLTSPTQQPTAIEGSTVTIAATATDDILVARVDFIVNGEIVATDTAEPYEYAYRVPTGVAGLAIQARATDTAGNSASTPTVNLAVIPDPGTTVIGLVLDTRGGALPGAAVTCATRSGTTAANGTFSIGSVPTVAGNIRCSASYSGTQGAGLTGLSSAVPPQPGGTTDVGTITLRAEVAQINRTTFTSDANFRLRALVQEGSLVVASSRRFTGGVADSDKVVRIDASVPSAPVFVETISTVNNAIWDVGLLDGYAYVASDDLRVIDFNTTPGTLIIPDRHVDNYAISVAPTDGYVFVGTDAVNGRINIFNNSNPRAPRFVRNQDLGGGVNFHQLLAYGSRYLIGITPQGSSDVWIIDRSDVNNLRTVRQIAVPQFAAGRGRVAGHMLYVVDASGSPSGVAVIDLTDPLNAKVDGFVATNGAAGGADALGADLVVANGSGGLAFVDASLPAAPVVTGSQAMPGTAWDVVLSGEYAYVAANDTFNVVGTLTPPRVTRSLVSLTREPSAARVTGAPVSVTGRGALTVTLTNQTTGQSESGIPVAGDGSFSSTVPASPGDTIALAAIDGTNRTSGLLVLGNVPFGSAVATSLIAPAMQNGDSGFRARLMEVEGATLVVTSWEGARSDKVMRFDVSDPLAPRFVDTTAASNNFIWDLAFLDGFAYVASDDLRVIDMNVTPSQLIIPDRHADNYATAVVVDGTYAFVACDALNGRFNIFDITNPRATHYLRAQDLGGGVNFHKLLTYGPNYLIGITPQGASDVWIIDRRDVNNLRIAAQLAIPGQTGVTGRVVGNLLYVSDRGLGGVSIVDLTNPLAPVLKSTTLPGGPSYGFDATGTTLAVGNGIAGVTFLDASNPAAPNVVASQPVPGSAWDVRFASGALFVAHETGISVFPDVAAPPAIDLSSISLTRAAGGATVTGSQGAITGQGTLTVVVANLTTGASTSAINVAADGSFSVLVAGASGDVIRISATDGANRVTTVTAGSIPFGASVITTPITIGMQKNDPSFRARLLEVEGSTLVVTSWEGARSDKVMRFDVSNPLAPQFVDTTAAGNNFIWDMAFRDGYAYIASDDLRVINMNVTPSQLIIPDRHADNYATAVAVDRSYAFVACDAFNARFNIFDITNPQAPHYLRAQDLGGGVNFHKLLTFGNDYLIGITPQGNSDVWIIDRRDVNNLRIAAQLAIPGQTGVTGRVVENLLYVSDRGLGGVAIVDLTNPLAPVLKSTTTPGGPSFGFDATGASVAIGNGGTGVTFLDTANPAAPRVVGSQPMPGTAWDVRFANAALYVAHETGISVLSGVVAPPTINTSLIEVTRATGGATVTGGTSAVTGRGSLSVVITNLTTGASTSAVTVAADGSFSVPVAGSPGDVIGVSATDGDGRTTGPVVAGSVPFGASVITTPITFGMQNNDPSFRARLMEVEGSTLVVTSWEGARSDKVMRFDVSNPLAPTFVDTTAAGNNFIWDMAFLNGYAYIASDDLRVINMNVTPSQLIIPDRHADNYTNSVAVDGNYAFVACDAFNARFNIFDITNPQAPRYLRAQDLGGGVNFHKLLPFGTDYLIGITPQGTDDVWVIDRRDVNNLRVTARLPIPGQAAATGRVVGNLLYVSDRGYGGVAIVDLANPSVPVLKSTTTTGGPNFGFDATGATVAIGNGGAGVTVLDATNPAVPRIVGTQSTEGTVWDVRFANGALYAAHETGISVVAAVAAPPTIVQSLVRIAQGAGGAVVTGAARAVAGEGTAFTVSLTDTVAGTTTSGIAVAADGSFSATLPASATPGHPIVAQALDGAGRASSKYLLGQVPFGSSVVTRHVTMAMQNNDSSFRSRLLRVEEDLLVVSSYEGARSDKVLRFDISNPLAPSHVDTTPAVNGFIYDIALKDGYVYVAADDLRLIDMNVTPSRVIVPDRHVDNYSLSVATDGQFAFVSTDAFAGRLNIFNVTNPQAPRFVRNQDLGGGVNFHRLLTFGTDYLIGITPEGTNDVWVIDRRNINNLMVVAHVPIAAFAASNARVAGNLLYVTRRIIGTSVAVVDLTNPAAPVLRSAANTRGYSLGMDVSGTTVAVGDGSPGITFFDMADPLAPRLLGSQFVGGTVWDVAFQNGVVWCTTEAGIAALQSFNLQAASLPSSSADAGRSIMATGIVPAH